MTNSEKIEDKAELLHNWYLYATKSLHPISFNSLAQVEYKDLTEEQKFIDRYIAKMIIMDEEKSTTDLKKEILGIIDKRIKQEEEISRKTDKYDVTTLGLCGVRINELEEIKKAILENETFSDFSRQAEKIEGLK